MKYATSGGLGDVAEAGAAQRHASLCAIAVSKEELRRICRAKCLQAQIQTVALRKSDRFRQCSIQVEKVGPAKIVPSHIAEWHNSGSWILGRISKARRGEPWIAEADAVKNFYRGNQIRRLRVVRRQKRGVTSSKVERKARHDGEKGGHAPATKDGGAYTRRNQALALSKRQIVHNTLHKGLRAIEVVAGVIAALINIEGQATIVARLKTHALTECVSRRGSETAREMPVKLHLQSVVAGRVSRKEEIRVRSSPEGVKLGLSLLPEAKYRRGVEIVIDHGVDAVVADVR